MKSVAFGFVLCCLVFFTPAGAAVGVKPDNLNISGGIFSFDLVIDNPDSFGAMSFKSTIDVSGPGTLTLDVANSTAVANDTDYWVYNNSAGGIILNDNGSDNYDFGDGALSPYYMDLVAGDIMARYAFTWDTAGDYTFILDLDAADSFVQDRLDGIQKAYQFTPGDDPGIIDSTSNSFTVTIPEPATITLLSLGGMALLRNRKRKA